MNYLRLTSAEDSLYQQAMALYSDCFPYHEQRETASQTAVMANPEYHFTLIQEHNAFIGCVLYWETANFIYVEHFFIHPERRNNAYGKRTLEWLCAKGKSVILEIDPINDDISARRKGFYERCGFTANPYPHIHPPYHAGIKGHDLIVMSSPEMLSADQYSAFNQYLHDRVMG